MPHPFATDLHDLHDRYLERFPIEKERLAPFTALLETSGDLRSRRHLPGHLTASAFVFNSAHDALLVVHNRNLDLWVQPGGHFDPGETPPECAAREAREETRLTTLELHPWHQRSQIPIDVDIHPIPANPKKGEPAHAHHDLRYVFVLREPEEVRVAPEEIAGFRWIVPVPEIVAEISPDLVAAVAKARRVLGSEPIGRHPGGC